MELPMSFISRLSPLEDDRYDCEHCGEWSKSCLDGGPYEASKWYVCYKCFEEFQEGMWESQKKDKNE